jgi:predicted dehydrogenase
MFSCTITQSDESSGWRASRENGGGAVFEMASHAIDLVNYLVGKPDKVIGSSINNIYSKNVEDAISSTFLYKNGVSGTLYINWSDTSYRKPTNKIEIFGMNGKILADQHSLKIYLNKPNEIYTLREGWNTLYITDVFKPVPFYVRGNEFTSQLYHFIDCIQGKEKTNTCTFADGVNVLDVIEGIFNDYEKNAKI